MYLSGLNNGECTRVGLRVSMYALPIRVCEPCSAMGVKCDALLSA